jgi:predicted RNA-binding protein with PIN domain
MIWLIDGYNVIRHDPELAGIDRRNLEGGRRELLRRIARVARGSRDEFLVVFDGARVGEGAPTGGQVRALFSRPPERADDILARLARQHGAGAIVVTSDNAIQAAGRRARAAVVSAEAFLERAAMPPRDPARPAIAPRDAECMAEADLEQAARKADDEEDPERPPVKRGNPRRLSRAERDRRRALGRLRSS